MRRLLNLLSEYPYLISEGVVAFLIIVSSPYLFGVFNL